MEPCLNPAVEAQAIGRVHRLGQTRPVVITRMIIENSVESRILSTLQKKFGESDGSKADSDAPDGKVCVSSGVGMVGSLKSDKAVMMSQEFDELFGVTKSAVDDNLDDEVHDDSEDCALL